VFAEFRRRIILNGDVMKKYTYILVAIALVVVWAYPASAIDRSKKDNPAPKQERPVVDKPVQKQAKTTTDGKATRNTGSRKKNYDDFVDRNNNGIDDRAEKGSKKTTPKKPKSAPKKTTPAKPKP